MSERERFSRDAQRYLDGEPHGVLEPAERTAADRLLESACQYGARLEGLDPAFDDAVMGAVRGRSPVRRRAAWRWLVEPRVVQIRPVWIPVLAAAALVALWVAGRAPARRVVAGPQTAGGAAVSVRDTVFVRFEVVAPDARAVAVAGSFNGWRPDALPMTRIGAGLWSVTVALPVGEHRYQFVVDGRRWLSDPTAHAQVDDGFGGTNSVIVVGPKGLVRT